MSGPELVIRAIGTPAPQGSFFARIVGKGRAQRAIVVADNAATKPWRNDVVAAAGSAMRAVAWLPLNEALAVEIVFLLPRPSTVTRAFPSTRPDLDKLARSTLDALADAVVFAEDGRVVDLTLRKRYADGVPCGAQIRVRAMSQQLVIV